MTTTPNMGLVLPVDHGSAEQWDILLDAVFTAIDSHAHTTGQGVPIASAALRINADVSWSFSGTNYAITDLKAVDFAPVATSAVASLAGALFVNSADSELYYRTTGGVNVKFTSGAALNVAAFTGGIGGDYSAVGALESFDDASDSYWLQQQGSPRPWAGLRVGNVDIYQQAASIVTRVRLQSPAALAASYAVVFPTALPAANSSLYIDNVGQLSTKPTLVLSVPASASNGVAALTNNATNWVTTVSSGPTLVAYPINLPIGAVIVGYTLWMKKLSNTTAVYVSQLSSMSGTTGGLTVLTPGTGTETNGANAPGFITLSKSGISFTVTAGSALSILLSSTASLIANDIIYHVEVSYQPV